MRFKRDFYLGLVFFMISVWLLFESQKIRRLRFDVLDNAFFPSMAAILMLIFSIALMLQSLFSKETPAPINFKRPIRVSLFVISCVVYIVLMQWIGFVFSSILFTFASCLIISWPFRTKTIVYSAIFSFTTSASIWYIFKKLLRLMLP